MNIALNYSVLIISYIFYVGFPILLIYFLAKRFITKRAVIIDNTRNKINDKSLEKFPVKSGNKIILIPEDEIIYFKAENNSVFLFNMEGKKYLLDLSLDELLDKLPNNYLKIHRSTIVNSNKIQEIQKYINGRYTLVMNDEIKSRLKSSRSNAQNIRNLYQF